MKNVIFIHAGNVPTDKQGQPNTDRCQQILDNIRDYILESKIYEDVDFISVELLGKNDVTFNVPKAIINHNGDDIYQWEFPTLYKIIEYAKHNSEDNILYLHTKGSSNSFRTPEFQWIEDVRNYQLYQNVIRYRESLEHLKTYDTCGAELIHNPVTHYSQNFWWAKARHILTLTPPKDLPIVFDDRHQCEFWICSRKDGKYKSIFNIYNDFLGADDFSKKQYIK